VRKFDRQRAVTAARAILEQGGWCVLEACVDGRSQRWEARVLIFDHTPEAVADAIEQEISEEPGHGARLTGCDRWTLEGSAAMGAHVI
jgi:predicted kinase